MEQVIQVAEVVVTLVLLEVTVVPLGDTVQTVDNNTQVGSEVTVLEDR